MATKPRKVMPLTKGMRVIVDGRAGEVVVTKDDNALVRRFAGPGPRYVVVPVAQLVRA
jgi:hypothetical protein